MRPRFIAALAVFCMATPSQAEDASARVRGLQIAVGKLAVHARTVSTAFKNDYGESSMDFIGEDQLLPARGAEALRAVAALAKKAEVLGRAPDAAKIPALWAEYRSAFKDWYTYEAVFRYEASRYVCRMTPIRAALSWGINIKQKDACDTYFRLKAKSGEELAQECLRPMPGEDLLPPIGLAPMPAAVETGESKPDKSEPEPPKEPGIESVVDGVFVAAEEDGWRSEKQKAAIQRLREDKAYRANLDSHYLSVRKDLVRNGKTLEQAHEMIRRNLRGALNQQFNPSAAKTRAKAAIVADFKKLLEGDKSVDPLKLWIEAETQAAGAKVGQGSYERAMARVDEARRRKNALFPGPGSIPPDVMDRILADLHPDFLSEFTRDNPNVGVGLANAGGDCKTKGTFTGLLFTDDPNVGLQFWNDHWEGTQRDPSNGEVWALATGDVLDGAYVPGYDPAKLTAFLYLEKNDVKTGHKVEDFIRFKKDKEIPPEKQAAAMVPPPREDQYLKLDVPVSADNRGQGELPEHAWITYRPRGQAHGFEPLDLFGVSAGLPAHVLSPEQALKDPAYAAILMDPRNRYEDRIVLRAEAPSQPAVVVVRHEADRKVYRDVRNPAEREKALKQNAISRVDGLMAGEDFKGLMELYDRFERGSAALPPARFQELMSLDRAIQKTYMEVWDKDHYTWNGHSIDVSDKRRVFSQLSKHHPGLLQLQEASKRLQKRLSARPEDFLQTRQYSNPKDPREQMRRSERLDALLQLGAPSSFHEHLDGSPLVEALGDPSRVRVADYSIPTDQTIERDGFPMAVLSSPDFLGFTNDLISGIPRIERLTKEQKALLSRWDTEVTASVARRVHPETLGYFLQNKAEAISAATPDQSQNVYPTPSGVGGIRADLGPAFHARLKKIETEWVDRLQKSGNVDFPSFTGPDFLNGLFERRFGARVPKASEALAALQAYIHDFEAVLRARGAPTI